jgi:hypothetical protein
MARRLSGSTDANFKRPDRLAIGPIKLFTPGFLSQPEQGEGKMAVQRRREGRLSRGLCPDCGRPLRLVAYAPTARPGAPRGDSAWRCTCGTRVVASPGSKLYKMARELSQIR